MATSKQLQLAPLKESRLDAVTAEARSRFRGITVAGKKLASYGFTLQRTCNVV